MANVADILMGRRPVEPDPLVEAASRKGVAGIDVQDVINRVSNLPPETMQDADPLSAAASTPVARGLLPAPPPQINRVPKSEIFRQLLSDFLQNVGAGMAAAGTGPGANVRGAGAAILAGPEREQRRQAMNFREQELEIQRQNAQSLAQQRTETTRLRGQMVEFDDPVTGQTYRVPMNQLAQLIRGAQAGTTTKQTTQAKIQSTEKIADKKIAAEADLKKAQTELTQLRAAGMKPDSPQFKLKQREVEARIALAQANLGLRRESVELAEARLALAQQRMEQPTAPTRTMAEAAPKVLNFINRIRPLVEQEASGLGPLAGRWSEFMAGKVGAPNAEYTKLRTNVGLLNTLLMRMHVGSRGGVQLLTHFKSLMDQGHQSPENLLASLQVVEEYANDVAGMAPQGGGSQQKGKVFSKSAWLKANPKGNVARAVAAAKAQGYEVVD